MLRNSIAAVAVCLAPFLATAQSSTPSYSLLHLGGGLGAFTGMAMNNRGMVAGYVGDYQSRQAAVWDGTQLRLLSAPPGSQSIGQDINNAGVVVGSTEFYLGSSSFERYATVWSEAGAATTLGSGDAWAINNSGSIAFGNRINQSADGLLLHANGQLETTPGIRRATSMNERGDVIGDAFSSNGTSALWDGESTTFLKAPVWYATWGLGINNRGTVVGALEWLPGDGFVQFATGAFVWDGQDYRILDGFDGFSFDAAWSINNRGQIVGDSAPCVVLPWGNRECEQTRGVLWEGNSFFDLNQLLDQSGAGYRIVSAHDINDRGQIMADAIDQSGQRSTVVLTPVPEPTTYALMACGLAMLVVRFRRRSSHSLQF